MFYKYLKSILILVLLNSTTFAQSDIYCDSLREIINHGMLYMPVDKMPELEKSFAQIMNEYYSLINTNFLIENIYVNVVIDTNGTVLCPYVFKGNQNITDSIALDYVMRLKFTPTSQRGRKVPANITIPFYKWSLKETKTMIKINGRWQMK